MMRGKRTEVGYTHCGGEPEVVAPVCQMRLDGGVWKLRREAGFWQRYTGEMLGEWYGDQGRVGWVAGRVGVEA